MRVVAVGFRGGIPRDLLYTSDCDPDDLPGWRTASELEWVTSEALPRVLETYRLEPRRGRMTLASWLAALRAARGRASPDAERLFDPLLRHDRPNVGDWADALDIHTETLRGLCKSRFGCPPKCVIDCIVTTGALDLVAQGFSKDRVAWAWGYADAGTLREVIDRHCGLGSCPLGFGIHGSTDFSRSLTL